VLKTIWFVVLGVLGVLGSLAVDAQAEVTFDWVTITDPGNAGWQHPGTPRFPPVYPWETPRGSVGHEYRIGRTEITTGQWIDFVNTFSTQGMHDGYFAMPSSWGADIDPTYHGPGFRWRLISDESAQWPVAGISWRTAATYANWLHNGQSADPQSLITGAYDSTTWGYNGRVFTDEVDHLPGAKYWIPSLDEWIKAVYYDPNKDGPGGGGWWTHPNGSDTALVPGLPGGGETSAGIEGVDWRDLLEIPVGSYPDTQTPWGLLDASGGASEWLETAWWPDTPQGRGYMPSSVGINGPFLDEIDALGNMSSVAPSSGSPYMGVRIVGAVPSPATPLILGTLVACPALALGRRRHSRSAHTLENNPRSRERGLLS